MNQNFIVERLAISVVEYGPIIAAAIFAIVLACYVGLSVGGWRYDHGYFSRLTADREGRITGRIQLSRFGITRDVVRR